jgi:hypothetical protein
VGCGSRSDDQRRPRHPASSNVPHVAQPRPKAHVSFWVRELPFTLVLILIIAGVAYTSFSKKPIVGYWEILAPIIALVCVAAGWQAHLDHAVASEAQVTEHKARIEARRDLAVANLADIDRRITQIDVAVDGATRRGRTTSAMALVAREADRRNELVADRARAASTLASIEVEKAGIENERNGLAADSGPVRYLSKLIGIDQDTATRWFVLFVSAF